jgi:hypothetical protein
LPDKSSRLKRHTYIGQITGVVCATCEAHISAALIAKLTGMEKIDITKGEKRRHEYDHHRFQGRGCHQGHGHVSARRPIQTYQITSLFEKK